MSHATTDTRENNDRVIPTDMSFTIHTDDHQNFEIVARFLCEDFVGLNELCDIRLRFNTDYLPVHSIVLAAHSSVFVGKFSMANKCSELDMSFLSKESVQRVLHYLYHGTAAFRFETLHNDLDAISYLGIGKLQEEVEKKLVEIARQGKCVEVLNMTTLNLKSIPHSLSTMLSISDETVCILVDILHDKYISNRMSFEEILNLSTNTVVTMLSARIADVKKVEIINMALKWIYEHRLSDHKASNILRVLTFGSLKYSQLVDFRNSLIQTVVPVTVGRCVRLKHQENDLLDLVFMHADHSSVHSMPEKRSPTKSTSDFSDATIPISSSTRTSSSSSHTVFQNGPSTSSSLYNIDDCTTAISFDADDLKRLGFRKP